MNTERIERLLRLPEVLSIVGIKKTSWYNGIKDGKFPAPKKLSRRLAVWPESQISKVVSDLLAQ